MIHSKPSIILDRFEFFTEWLPYPIVELDPAINIIYFNKAAEHQFPNLTTLHKEHPVLQGLDKLLADIFKSSSEIVVFERELKLLNLIYEQKIFAFPNSKKIFLFMTDTTHRKQAELARSQAESQLAQAQKMEAIGELTGGIAHDFNNILMIIIGNLQLQQAENNEHKIDNRRINSALEAAARGSSLSKRLLAFARKKNLQPTIISVSKFMLEMVDLIKPILGSPINIELKEQDILWHILVDPPQLENAILNLAVNASHAMNGKGNIVIDLSNVVISNSTEQDQKIEPGDYVKISIHDTGSGIKPEIMDKIFQPFFTTKPSEKGTGLGLSMVSAFVVQSKGYITVESQVNRGTTFNLFFPKVIGEEHTDENSSIPPMPSKNKLPQSKVILVVDDEESIRTLELEYLKKLGYTLLEAASGDNALDLLQSHAHIDLILSDIAMPGRRTGIELANEAKKIQPSIKILLTSGHLSKHASEKCKYKILNKPYELDDLALILDQMLEEQ